MKFRVPKNPGPLRYGQKKCPDCGQWRNEIKSGPDAGRIYDDNGQWHNCDPDPKFAEKEAIRRAEWEAGRMKGEDKREMRSRTPLYLRGRK